MPQLPSGRHVGLADGPVQELAKTGNMGLKLAFYKAMKKPADLAPVICITYFHPSDDDSILGEPYLSDLTLADIGTEKCDWSEEDLVAFNAWLELPRSKDFLQSAYDELKHIIETVKVVMPDNLKGVMEPEEFELVRYLFTEEEGKDLDAK
jgi:hypothetical protein